MKLKTKLMMFTAAMALSSTMAFAAITGNDVVASYQAEAYSYIQVKEGPTQIKVEAIKDGQKIEVIYDKASGAVLKSETSTANPNEATRTGVFVRQVGRDFDRDGNGDDDSLDDNDDDNGNDDDNDDSDDNGNDDGDDDHGGDDDNDDDGDDSDDDNDDGGDDGGDDNDDDSGSDDH